MSLLPHVFRYERPRSILDQHFGLCLSPDDVLTTVTSPPLLSRDYYRPWRHLAAAARDSGSTIKNEADKFEVNLDVQHFSPEEIKVNTADGCIVVEGKHEEKQDEHGYISRQFVRRYALPKSCDPEAVQSKLSSDGVLIITVPKKPRSELEGERVVPIMQTGPVKEQIDNKIVENK